MTLTALQAAYQAKGERVWKGQAVYTIRCSVSEAADSWALDAFRSVPVSLMEPLLCVLAYVMT